MIFLTEKEINVTAQERKESFSNDWILMGHCKYSRPVSVGFCQDSWVSKYFTTLKMSKQNRICIKSLGKLEDNLINL